MPKFSRAQLLHTASGRLSAEPGACSWRFSGMGKKARAGQSFVGTCGATAQLQSWLTLRLGKLGQMDLTSLGHSILIF